MRLLVIILSAAPLAAGPALLPDQPVPGWKAAAPAEEYPGSRLYDAIDGGADVYLNAGFAVLITRRYAGNGGREAEVKLFDQGAPLRAFGLFRQIHDSSIPNLFQFHKGKFVGELTDRSSPPLPAAELAALAGKISVLVPGDTALPAEFARLPAAGRVPGSEGYALKNFLSRRALADVLFAGYSVAGTVCTLFVIQSVAPADSAALRKTLAGMKDVSFMMSGMSAAGVKGNVAETERRKLLPAVR